ncbi:ABC transporter permease [Aurantibacter crassamenti]|uniref:ABC transporter permease n=1 Tax=Aurantibacter crassamenti TaxID=1837375 RepID=UPI001EEE300F|nr:FtsX-like permease family protein [Aurantibacter crassamenti]
MSYPKRKVNASNYWLVKMAWRDCKASSRRLLLFMASIILGIAAVVSIQSFSENLKFNISLQSRALMGADYRIDSNNELNERVLGIVDSLGGANGREISFPSMATFSNTEATKLVLVRGVEGGFPFYGELLTEPQSASEEYQQSGGALVDATLMLQFKLKVGDSIKVGNLTLPISGSLSSSPGSTGLTTTIAPPVFIPLKYIEQTGLVQKGSRIRYNYYFVADPDLDLKKFDEVIDPILDAENADLDTHLSTARQLGRRYENVAKFLNLVAFIALLLGCIGIASSVHIYIKEKLQSVAVLKCIGATRKQAFLIYLIQIAGIGLLGGIIGTLLGLALQWSFPMLLQGFLPFEVQITWAIQPIIMGVFLGLFMAVLFALSALMSTWYISPLQVLRAQEDTSEKSKRATILIGIAIVCFVYLFSFWLLDSFKLASGFVLGVVVTFSILAGIAKLLMWTIKTYFPVNWSFNAKQSLRNLYRTNSQTMVMVLAIGVGTFLISNLYFTKDFLLAKASVEAGSKAPNIILLDIQTDEKDAVIDRISVKGLPIIDNIPIVTMRVHDINGRAANDIRKDTLSEINHWVLNHEFRVTYRDSLIASETLLSGEWTNESKIDNLIPISLADNVARNAKVEVGDKMTFNVQGVLMKTIVASIREVDWARMQLNFSIVFPTEVLENAPQFHVLSTKVPDAQASAELQQDLVRKFPTVSILDLRQMINLVEGILDKITWVINFMAFFSILTGIIVLIGAVRTSKYQRIKENVLLRTLGAKSRQILTITALEYIYLGILGAGVGILLSLISSQLLAYFVFDTPFVPSIIPFLVILPAIALLVLFIGLFNSSSVIKSPPLEVLRKEGA